MTKRLAILILIVAGFFYMGCSRGCGRHATNPPFHSDSVKKASLRVKENKTIHLDWKDSSINSHAHKIEIKIKDATLIGNDKNENWMSAWLDANNVSTTILQDLTNQKLDSLYKFANTTSDLLMNYSKKTELSLTSFLRQQANRNYQLFQTDNTNKKILPIIYNFKNQNGNKERLLLFLNNESLEDLVKSNDWNTAKLLLRNIPLETWRNYLKDNYTKIKSLNEVRPLNLENDANESENITEDLSILSINDFGEFYLFDIVKDSCCHAAKVLDVVKQVLTKYNLQYALEKVTTFPVNYFSNIKECDSLYLLKANAQQKDIKDSKFPLIDSITIQNQMGNDDKTPTEYLRMIYQLATDRKPDIISSSYIGLCDQPYCLMAFAGSNIKTNYFSAADNDSGDIDNAVFGRGDGEEFSTIEPIASYLMKMNKEPVIVIGNQIDTTKFAGWHSSSGKNIGALGKGVHWGQKNCTRCIDTLQDAGTSFATPEVATKLFIAKAYWRKKISDTITALDARLRLLLATDLQPVFVSKFGSGGSINLNKLLQTSFGYLVKNNNEIVPLDTVWSASVSTLKDNYYSMTKITAKPSFNGVASYRGFYFKNSKTFAFRNGDSLKWEEIPKPDEINFTVRLKDGSVLPISTKEFYDNYQQIVILK